MENININKYTLKKHVNKHDKISVINMRYVIRSETR